MARRKKKNGGAGASLDSLLDTMTNVVGILVIVLILTQLGVGDAVKRISEGLPDITLEQLQLAQQEADELRSLLEELNEKKEEVEARATWDLATAEHQRKLVEELKRDLTELMKASVDLAKLRKEAEQLRKQVKELEQKIAEGTKRIEVLKGLLSETPEPGPPPEPHVVTLPNPRPAPKGAEPIRFVCRGGRIALFDQKRFEELAVRAVKSSQGRVAKSGKTVAIDCSRLLTYLQRRKIGDPRFQIAVKVIRGVPQLVPQMRDDAGDTLERLKRGNSQFEGFLRNADPRKNYIKFLVWSDSFDVYLLARQIASRRRFAAGWVPYDKNAEWRIKFPFAVTCSDQPPPPKPKTSPKPAQAAKPAVPPPPPLPPGRKRPPPDEID